MDLSTCNIIIPSYLGHTPEIQNIRLEYHLEQRKKLKKQFPKMEIISICSGYNHKQRLAVSNLNCHFIDQPTLKHHKYALIFRRLARLSNKKSYLLLDDDTLPDEDNEFGLDTLQILNDWLKKPETIPASVIFFSVRGLLHDTFTNNRPPTVYTAPMHIVGQMILFRNDFKLKVTDEDFRHYQTGGHVTVDGVFRMKLASMGIPVGKHRGVFNQSLTGTKNTISTIAQNQSDRREHNKITDEHIKHKWPWLFQDWKGKRLKPIWEQRGKKLHYMLSVGTLQRNKEGILYPNPTQLKELYEKKQSRPTLMEFLK
jgi:hypothetical protein